MKTKLPKAITDIQSAAIGQPLRAFHGAPVVREFYLNRVESHRIADEIVAGQYWERGQGCAVGCTIHGNDHAAYERELGIPTILARLEDRLFESIFWFDPEAAKEWPTRFLSAAKTGAELTMVWPKFAHWMLVDDVAGVIRFAKTDKTKAYIHRVAELYYRWLSGNKPAKEAWDAHAASATATAAYTTTAAADAADAYAAYAADAYAAYAADAAYAAYAAADAAADACNDHYKLMADKLIQLMQDVK